MSHHIGRSFTGHHLEDQCPCPKEKCGLVDNEKANPECEHHKPFSAQTIRQGHLASDCWTLGKGASSHRVTVVDGKITKFECTNAEAACHIYPECYCQTWETNHSSLNGKGHAIAKHDDCWLEWWFELGTEGTVYIGTDCNDARDDGIPSSMTRTGLIDHTYEDCILWYFEEEPEVAT